MTLPPFATFDEPVFREGTHADKYDLRERLFGRGDVAPFWVADMDLPSPAFLAEALARRVAHPLFGYTTAYDEVFDAICWWMHAEHGLALTADQLRLSPSVVTSIATAIAALSAPRDRVVVMPPVYGPFLSLPPRSARRVLECPLRIADGRHTIDFDRLDFLLHSERPALLLFCSPHNPGGRVWTMDELSRLVTACRDAGTKIFCDEIHCDIVYPPARHVPLLTVPGARDIAICAHSIGKTFNTSGLQASFVMVCNEVLQQRFADAAEQAHAGGVNLLGKVALETVLSKKGAQYKRSLVDYLGENAALVCDILSAVPGLLPMRPEGTFLVWCDFSAFGPWPAVQRRLVNEAGVALSGGSFFGAAGEGWFRMNIAHPRKPLLAAAQRIAAVFSRP